MEATCSSGNTLDWFMVSGGLTIAAETNVDKDTQCLFTLPGANQNWRQTKQRSRSKNQKDKCIRWNDKEG
eukprot:13184579-Heterocapsa_arctica.AAC.1